MDGKQKKFKKDELISRTGAIADAFSVFIAAGGNIAVWILFACMIANIIDAAVSFPTAVSLGIMLIQAVMLDIAGFGLQTIAKRLLKVDDPEVQIAARKGRNLAGWLIFMMVVTLVLVSSKTLAPMVIVNNTKLVSTIQNWIDIIDKSLILARIAVTVLYTHTIHNLRDTEAEMQETEEQQMEVNDQRILEIDQRLDTLARVDVAEVSQMVQELAGSVHTLSKQYTELSARYTELYTQVSKVCTQLSEVVDKVHKPVDMTVYTQRLDALESMVKISVTEVKQNILQITQNNLYTQLPTRIHEVVDTSTEDVDEGTPCLPEYVPTTDKHAVIPVLEVPGVSENKVREVLTAFLNGTSWRDIPGNYSRTIKPIREAYDAYMSTQVHEGVYTYTNA